MFLSERFHEQQTNNKTGHAILLKNFVTHLICLEMRSTESLRLKFENLHD